MRNGFLSWTGDAPSLAAALSAAGGRFEVVLAADVVYPQSTAALPALLETVRASQQRCALCSPPCSEHGTTPLPGPALRCLHTRCHPGLVVVTHACAWFFTLGAPVVPSHSGLQTCVSPQVRNATAPLGRALLLYVERDARVSEALGAGLRAFGGACSKVELGAKAALFELGGAGGGAGGGRPRGCDALPGGGSVGAC